jgi:polar amino acid transport system permease protein
MSPPYPKSGRIGPTLIDITKYLLLMAAITWLMVNSTRELGYHWQWYRVPRYLFS